MEKNRGGEGGEKVGAKRERMWGRYVVREGNTVQELVKRERMSHG